MIGAVAVWVLVALGMALVLGRGIRLADGRARAAVPLTTADLPPAFRPDLGGARR